MDNANLTNKELIIKEKILLGQYTSGVPNSWYSWKAVKLEIRIRELQEL